MFRHPSRRRFALRAVAAALAVGYVFLAAVGDGLHGLVCISGCCDADCLFCHHGDDCHKTVPGTEPCDSCPSKTPQPHDSDCEVCRLLAQLKTASTTIEIPAQVTWAAAPAPPESDPKAPSLSLPATSARGPPIA